MNAPRAAFLVTLLALSSASAQEKKSPPPAKATLPTGYLNTKEWLKYSASSLMVGEIDTLIAADLKKAGLKTAPLTTDEQFIRRVYLDITGRLPVPADVTDFLKDTQPAKRARLIDKLLDSDEYAQHWANYWREVITSRTTDQKVFQFVKHFEFWLTQELKANKSWGTITREILNATGQVKQDEPEKNGQAFFLGSRFGADATTELAAETSRIFLGIQIQCAQCHDHPSDVWKREQFHEFAAFFARVKERPIRDGQKFVGQQLVSLPFGEHRMPSKADPKQTTAMKPKFLDGKTVVAGFSSDSNRRKTLAEAVVSKGNPWFAGAYVNRIWGALMGQAFYQPVDDMGPEKEVMMPEVLARVAGAFRGSDYDVKQLFREILNSQTYQRQIRPGESPEDHLLFAASNPNRLPADMLWHSLVGVLGNMEGPQRPFGMMAAAGPFARFRSFEFTFNQEFAYDPSSKAEDVEGSVSQALLLMNNPIINAKLKAQGANLLGRVLASYSTDDEALRIVYLKTLARRPTDRELSRCKVHIRDAGNRPEAYEDILWALINSTEFQTRR